MRRSRRSPNPRLQRTPSAALPSPLSRQPLGDRKVAACIVVLMCLAHGLLGQSSSEPNDVWQPPKILPASIAVSEDEIVRMLVPEYDQKSETSKTKMADKSDSMAWWYTYSARVVSYRRTDLGVPGEDFLIIAIQENETPCHSCGHSIFGGVDLKRRRSMSSFRAESSSPSAGSPIVLIKKGKPWRLIFQYEFFGVPAGSGVAWKREASLVPDTTGGWSLKFGRVEKQAFHPDE